jgi:hypothetical protein
MLFLHINFNHCCNHNIQGKDNGLLESTPEIHPPNLIQGQEGNFFYHCVIFYYRTLNIPTFRVFAYKSTDLPRYLYD